MQTWARFVRFCSICCLMLSMRVQREKQLRCECDLSPMTPHSRQKPRWMYCPNGSLSMYQIVVRACLQSWVMGFSNRSSAPKIQELGWDFPFANESLRITAAKSWQQIKLKGGLFLLCGCQFVLKINLMMRMMISNHPVESVRSCGDMS